MCKEGIKFLAYVGRVYSCRAGGCSIQMLNDPEGEYEYFDYFILFDSQRKESQLLGFIITKPLMVRR